MKTLLSILFLFTTSLIYGHNDIYIPSPKNDGNLYLEHSFSWRALEPNGKDDILFRLLSQQFSV